MGLFDFWTGEGEYGGGTSWETDLDAAYDQAVAWIEQAATARGWSAAERENAIEQADDAYTYAAFASVFSSGAETFWSKLAEYWMDQDAAVPPGWDKLGDTFANAGSVSYSPVERQLANVKETAGDITSDVVEKIDPTRSVWPWVAGAAALAGLYLFAKR